jgi:hypothetical protein
MPSALHSAKTAMVFPCIKNVCRRSLSSGLNPSTPACAECFRTETRKDSAVHVSLSSSQLVKQPGTSKCHLLWRGEISSLIFQSEIHRVGISWMPAPRRERTSRPSEGRKQPLFSEFFTNLSSDRSANLLKKEACDAWNFSGLTPLASTQKQQSTTDRLLMHASK